MHVIEKSRETVEQLLARRNLPKTYEEKCQYALDLVDMHLHEENEHPIPVSCGHRRHLRYGIGNVLINEESNDDDTFGTRSCSSESCFGARSTP
jgi:redox-sensitive bicupin YhaK (pirin superfamily)